MTLNDVVFSLLKESLFGISDKQDTEIFPSVSEKDIPIFWTSVYDELQDQSVLGLTASIISKHHEVPYALFRKWNALKKSLIIRYVQMEAAQNAAIRLIQESGIRVAVIRGIAVSCYYPMPEYRSTEGVDLLVRPNDYNTVIRLLTDNGFVLLKKGANRYCTAFRKYNVLYNLYKTPVDAQSTGKCRKVSKYILSGLDVIETKAIGQNQIPVLPWKQSGMERLWCINQQLDKGLCLKQIIDWMMFVTDTLDDIHMREYMPELRRCGLDQLAIVVTKLCQKYLGLPFDNITWCEEADEKLCDDLMTCIMRQGLYEKHKFRLGKEQNKLLSKFHTKDSRKTDAAYSVNEYYKMLPEKAEIEWDKNADRNNAETHINRTANIRYSVAVATYNGEKFIEEQIQSILNQTIPVCEIIISDDGSKDHTIEIINSIDSKDIPVKCYVNTGRHGPSGNFENAIGKCTGDYIFLSDQDDIWFPQKVEKFNAFILSHPYAKCITSDGITISSTGEKLSTPFSILSKNMGYYYRFKREEYLTIASQKAITRGMSLCCTREFLGGAMPFPDSFERHDHWILFCAVCEDSLYAVNAPLVMYRLHDENVIGLSKTWKITESVLHNVSSQLAFYHKNWNDIVNNDPFTIRLQMIKKMEEMTLQYTRAYRTLKEQIDIDYKHYKAIHSSGLKGAISLLKLYVFNPGFRNENTGPVLVYKMVRTLIKRHQ